MIVIVAPYPSEENQKDGMIQRVAHIDELIASSNRVYLDLSLRRFFRKQINVAGLVTVYKLNLFFHFFKIAGLLKGANLVYIHSAYNALKTMVFSTNAHIVFDAHGVVPEEVAQEGKAVAARIYAFAERYAFRRCNTLVCVTRSMLRHFKAKYGERSDREEIILPILPRLGANINVDQALNAKRHARTVIYAGGMQVWQNVDKMIVAASSQPQLSYTFLTGSAAQFKAHINAAAIPHVCCESVPPDQVKNYYLKHNFGFILREPNLVNLVACPTKLVEYLYWGVLPIVITPRIGDFDETNLSCLTLEAFVSGQFPDEKTAIQMRRINQDSVLALISSSQSYQERLRRLLLESSQKHDTVHFAAPMR